MTGAEALRHAIPRLRAAGIDDPATDARHLLAFALGIGPDRLLMHSADQMTDTQSMAYDAAISQRLARRPVAQITGQRQFWGLSFRVTADTLDPRPETETLVSEALSRPFLKMLDLGTGTGCILLSCLKSMPMAQGTGVDISAPALAVAAGNAAHLGLQNRARFQQSDWFTNVAGAFDLIVSNPPYIAADEMPGLAPEVQKWEPHFALTPGGDGLDAYRKIAQGAGGRLMPGGRLMVEIGPTQGNAVAAFFAASGLADIRILPDLDGRDRVVSAVKPGDQDSCGCA